MKHPVHTRHRGAGVEWLQAIFTLLVLTGIYFSSGNWDIHKPPPPPLAVSGATQSYWNDSLGYGFRGNDGDSYTNQTGSGTDQVSIAPRDGLVYGDRYVRVSFYAHDSIESIESKQTDNVPRTYSRLSNGIAVIEGDLASATAKNVLATLHAR